MTRAARRDDAGQAGGYEIIPFGLLVFVAGTLLIIDIFSVVDAHRGVQDAARAGAQASVHASSRAAADAAARRAAMAAIDGNGRTPARILVTFDDGFVRCGHVTVTVEEHVPAIRLPFVGGVGRRSRVTGTQTELIDPFRDGLGASGACGD